MVYSVPDPPAKLKKRLPMKGKDGMVGVIFTSSFDSVLALLVSVVELISTGILFVLVVSELVISEGLVLCVCARFVVCIACVEGLPKMERKKIGMQQKAKGMKAIILARML